MQTQKIRLTKYGASAPSENGERDPPEQNMPTVQMEYALLHKAVDKDAKVAFLTMMDGMTGSLAATACSEERT